MSGHVQHPEVHDEYEWTGACHNCGRERTLKTRVTHGSKALCDECAAEPHKLPSAAGVVALPSNTRVSQHAPATDAGDWSPVVLDALLKGQNVEEAPELLTRGDDAPGTPRALFYRGKLHSISGEPESGKGWLALHAAAQVFDHYVSGQVVYVDFEDGPQSIVSRLLALGVSPLTIRDRLRYVRPSGPVNRSAVDELLLIDDTHLVILDGVTEGMVLHGLDPLSNTDIAAWREKVVRPFSDPFRALVEIDHVVKDKESRGRFALGGIHKLAGVDVAYGVKVISPFARGRSGKLKLTVHKDRPGFVRGFATQGTAAIVDIESHDDAQVRVTLAAPDDQAQPDTGFRPTVLMERVSRQIEETPALSWSAIRATVKGNNKAIDLALELLVAEGFVRVEIDGQARRHYPVKPFREVDDGTLLNPAPHPALSRVVENPAPLPTPLKAGAGFDGHASPPESLTLNSEGAYDPALDMSLPLNERLCLIEVAESFQGSSWEVAA